MMYGSSAVGIGLEYLDSTCHRMNGWLAAKQRECVVYVPRQGFERD